MGSKVFYFWISEYSFEYVGDIFATIKFCIHIFVIFDTKFFLYTLFAGLSFHCCSYFTTQNIALETPIDYKKVRNVHPFEAMLISALDRA